MKKIQSILVVTPNYPYEDEHDYPFVKTLCDTFAGYNKKITVLSPQSINSQLIHRKKTRPVYRKDIVNGNAIEIYQPKYITAPFRCHNINNLLIRLCLLLFFTKHKNRYDVCYCHFWNSAFAVLPVVRKKKIPLFVATGESAVNHLFRSCFGIKKLNEYVSGVICVSSKNRDESIRLGLTNYYKCKVFPNAVNASIFYKRDRDKSRKQLGFSLNAFIVAFVGWFIERKGVLRVASALDKVDSVNSIFIGKGNQNPNCKGILFKDSLQHEQIPLYLSAADVFVLPTQHEGCCNAVVEAMACGLPVISSNLPFNWDVLNETNSILVDPNNVDEIADAINELKNNGTRRTLLSSGALNMANKLTIDQRAYAILEFMEEKI